MKARVKATGEIVSVQAVERRYGYSGRMIVFYEDDEGRRYADNLLDFDNPDNTPDDYWTRLEHQYAGMAMQGILSNNELYREICKSRNLEITIMEYAHALVENLKGGEK